MTKYKLVFRSPYIVFTRFREQSGACEIFGHAYLNTQQRAACGAGRRIKATEVPMSLDALRISAIALGAAALTSLSPISTASAAAVVRHPIHAAHHYAGRGHVHHYAYRHGHRYVYPHGHRYAYGYDPGAAVAGAVIGGALGAAAGYPYGCDPYSNGPWGYGSCPAYDSGGYDGGPYYGGFGYGYGPAYGGGFYGHGFGHQAGRAGFASGNFGHMGRFGGGRMGGFGGHTGGFGGHMGGFGGGHITR
jgi:hypothetical protein